MTALAGVRVLDLSASGAGSLAAGLLADFGADVVKVIDNDPRCEAAPVRGLADWLVWNRGKRVVTVSAGNEQDRDALRELAVTAELLVADAADALTELGVTWSPEDGRVLLITPPYDEEYCAWAGSGESPELLDAISGLASFQTSYSGWPVASLYPFLRTAHASWAATCAVAALVERLGSGLGQQVVVTGLHAANVFATGCVTRAELEPDADRAVGPGGQNAMYTRYQAGDGVWLFIGGLGPKFVDLILGTLDLRDLLEDPRIAGDPTRLWHIDNSRWVIDRVQALIATRPAAHWIELLEAADVPCSLLMDRSEWARSEQMSAMGQIVRLVDPVLGEIELPGTPVASDVTPASIRPISQSVPARDAQWLAARTPKPKPRNPRSSSSTDHGPLAAYSAAVLGSFVAGPYVGPLLAELGMEVTKVEPPAGDPWRVQGISVNRGVRSIAVDLADADARRALLEVLGTRDVVVDNFRRGVTSRLGIDHAQLKDINPDVLTVSVTAYGERGPLAHLPGYDTVLQAAGGIMTAQGGDGEPVIYSMPPNDLTTAILGAYAAVLALHHREHTGRTQHISTSLGTTAVFLQGPDIARFPGREPARAGGRDFRGGSAGEGIYQVLDGWVRLHTDRVDVEAWAAAGLPVDPSALDADDWAEIGRILSSLPRETALKRLASASVPAVPARRLSEVAADPNLHKADYLGWTRMKSGERMCTVNRLARYSRTPQTEYFLPPGLGQHSRELLAAAGLPPQTIDQLVRTGVVIDGRPMEIVLLPAYR